MRELQGHFKIQNFKFIIYYYHFFSWLDLWWHLKNATVGISFIYLFFGLGFIFFGPIAAFETPL